MSAKKPLVICLMGPTASGKTRLAIELTQKIPADIISVDSAMVYRGMDIGSAKPSAAELKMAPHLLVDIREPKQTYSASDFVSDATPEIKKIIANKRIPLLVGGTMLYFRALQQGLNDMPTADSKIRQQLEERIQRQGVQSLHAELAKVDPLAAQRIHANDPQRIQRALEVFYVSGKPMSEWQNQQAENSDFDFLNIALIPSDREKLRELIAFRFERMLEQGFVDEVKKLYAEKKLTKEMSAARAVGYRQVLSYINDEMSFDEMRDKAITATRKLAKRQLTWLRRWPCLNELKAEDASVDYTLKLIEQASD